MDDVLHSALTAQDLESELDRTWSELQADGELRRTAISVVPAAVQILNGSRSDAFSVKQTGAGLSGAEIIVVFGPVLAQVAKDLWTHVILPKIRQDRGDDIIEEKEE